MKYFQRKITKLVRLLPSVAEIGSDNLFITCQIMQLKAGEIGINEDISK